MTNDAVNPPYLRSHFSRTHVFADFFVGRIYPLFAENLPIRGIFH